MSQHHKLDGPLEEFLERVSNDGEGESQLVDKKNAGLDQFKKGDKVKVIAGLASGEEGVVLGVNPKYGTVQVELEAEDQLFGGNQTVGLYPEKLRKI